MLVVGVMLIALVEQQLSLGSGGRQQASRQSRHLKAQDPCESQRYLARFSQRCLVGWRGVELGHAEAGLKAVQIQVVEVRKVGQVELFEGEDGFVLHTNSPPLVGLSAVRLAAAAALAAQALHDREGQQHGPGEEYQHAKGRS